MRPMRKIFRLFFGIICVALCLAGCCNTKFKVKQLKDDMHTYFLDGDPEALSEAEPDSAI